MRVDWGEHEGRPVLVVRGLPRSGLPHHDLADGPAPARVYPTDVLRDGRPGGGPSMAGRWTTDGAGALLFVPRFAFLASTSYTVVPTVPPDGGDGDDPSVVIESPPVGGSATTRVLSVEPSGPVVPRNLLRLYVTFSAPMSEGRASRHLRLERADSGELLADALLALDPELWDVDRRRLTVLLDPARIKRGLAPHLEAGYPLEEGQRVRLVVGSGYPDAEGRPLTAGIDTTYEVGPDLRGHVRPDRWVPEVPAAGTLDPLVLRFDRQLDRPLAARCIRVVGVPGAGEPAPDGRWWRFVPDERWPVGSLAVMVDPMLEDVAGNSVVRVFDRDLELNDDDPVPVDDAVTIGVVITAG